MTLAVSNLEQQIGELKHSGIDAGERMRSARVNVMMIKDPDGNSIALAEAVDPRMAH